MKKIISVFCILCILTVSLGQIALADSLNGFFSDNFDDGYQIGDKPRSANNINNTDYDKFSIVNPDAVDKGLVIEKEDGVNNQYLKMWNDSTATTYINAYKMQNFTNNNQMMLSFRVKVFENEAYFQLEDQNITPITTINILALYKANSKYNIGVSENGVIAVKGTYLPNDWLDVKIHFNFANNKMTLWVEDVLINSGKIFDAPAQDLSKMYFKFRSSIPVTKFTYLDDINIYPYNLPEPNSKNTKTVFGTYNTLFSDDFKNRTPTVELPVAGAYDRTTTNWSAIAKATGTVTVEQEANGNNYLKLTSTNTTADDTIRAVKMINFTDNKKAIIDFRVKTNGKAVYVDLNNYKGGTNTNLIGFYLGEVRNGSNGGVGGNVKIGDIVQTDWNDVTLMLDFDADTIHAFVNGAFLSQYKLYKDATWAGLAIDQVNVRFFGVFRNNNVQFDDIVIRTNTSDVVKITPELYKTAVNQTNKLSVIPTGTNSLIARTSIVNEGATTKDYFFVYGLYKGNQLVGVQAESATIASKNAKVFQKTLVNDQDCDSIKTYLFNSSDTLTPIMSKAYWNK